MLYAGTQSISARSFNPLFWSRGTAVIARFDDGIQRHLGSAKTPFSEQRPHAKCITAQSLDKMPPIVPRKRLRDTPEDDESNREQTKSNGKIPASAAKARKVTLHDALDSTSTPPVASFLDGLKKSDDSDSSLTSLSDEEFEDVRPPPSKKLTTQNGSEVDDEDEDMEFEDVTAPEAPAADAPVTGGDLELTLHRDPRMSLTNMYGDKKGPTKREKKVRNATHKVHVLFLLWHNALRNAWLCDQEVQATLISHLPWRLWEEVDRFRRASGLEKPTPPSHAQDTKAKSKGKGKGKKPTKPTEEARDWGHAAERLENGKPDMSHGDPLFRLMQSLSSWWKQRFKITTPGLRKRGYMPLERLDRLTKAHKNNIYDPELFGERISSLDDFRRCARSCRGSRDVGSQLFTALLRGLNLEARMVANLQTLGFGWTKLEDADPESQRDMDRTSAIPKYGARPEQTSSEPKPAPTTKPAKGSSKQTSNSARSRKAKTTDTVVIDDSDELEADFKDSDDESIIELESIPRRPAKQSKKFDLDLEYPHYWTEVLSPVTHKYLPVDPIVKGIVATNRDLVESLEPRGAKADKARQIMAYVVGYSPDGTAKDVTVRYLKKQLWPGRTKGHRAPIEKVPVYDRNGKIKRQEQADWFKAALSGYRRGSKEAPLTEVDELEEATDLRPAQPEKKEVKEGEETLQYYKQSKEFALERHLKREEALRPGAKPVKKFKNKVKGGKVEEEDVFLRADILNVKSAETWHKQGRAPLAGERPLKRVPYRAATTNRRREIAEAEAATGEKVLQGLFSFDQTDWIIPPPIENGIIPKNDYGNIDLFAEHMCPQGAVHVPFRGAAKVCKRIQIDYAEAVVDFEFGHRMAVPVIQGVVIAEEYHDQVMRELEKDEAERRRKEDEKRRKVALGKWRKFLMGMRIAQKIREEYGDFDMGVSVFAHSKDGGAPAGAPIAKPSEPQDEEMAGGFLPEGHAGDDFGGGGFLPDAHEEDEVEQGQQTSAYFPTAAADEDDDDDDGGLVMEDHRNPVMKPVSEPAPLDLHGGSTRGSQDEASDDPDRNPTNPTRRTRGGRGGRGGGSRRASRRQPSLSDSAEESVDEQEAVAGEQPRQGPAKLTRRTRGSGRGGGRGASNTTRAPPRRSTRARKKIIESEAEDDESEDVQSWQGGSEAE